MQLYSGKNHLYANQGKAVANLYGEMTEQFIKEMKNLHRKWLILRMESGQGWNWHLISDLLTGMMKTGVIQSSIQ